jgi:hypothetical protein
MERETGIEPAPSAWKAEVLPLNYSRPARNSSTRPYRRYGVRRYDPVFQPCLGYPWRINWWREVDSNHRRRKPADLQSAPVGRLGIPPTKNGYCVDRGVMCQHLGGSKRPIFLDFLTILTRLFSRFRRRVYRPIAPCSWRAQADAALSLADDVRCRRAASTVALASACHRVYRAQQTP